MSAINCPWCKHAIGSYPASAACERCGGALPAPSGAERGVAPPPTPRALPEAYVRSLFGWGDGSAFALVVAAFGGLFALIGVGLTFVLPPLGCGFVGFGGLFGGIGALLYYAARRPAKRRLAALTHGVATEGEVVGVALAKMVIDGQQPWELEYVYLVDGRPTRGVTTGWDAALARRQKGEPIWVVYVPGNPKACSVWPPVS